MFLAHLPAGYLVSATLEKRLNVRALFIRLRGGIDRTGRDFFGYKRSGGIFQLSLEHRFRIANIIFLNGIAMKCTLEFIGNVHRFGIGG